MNLRNKVEHRIKSHDEHPFSVYTSFKEQKLLNVPIAKPLLIVVLSGEKQLGHHNELVCHAGDFIFLPASHSINMRNIPKSETYFALLIEFDFHDFSGLQTHAADKANYCLGQITPQLEQCLHQFVDVATWAPKPLWSLRKREIISLLSHQGHDNILSLLASPKLADQVHEIFIRHGFIDSTSDFVSQQLAMSESTMRRKLALEGTSVQQVKDNARLGLALHLLQTSALSIGLIAEKCGYQSQSRFTERFKLRFGLTPSELRKTKLTD